MDTPIKLEGSNLSSDMIPSSTSPTTFQEGSIKSSFIRSQSLNKEKKVEHLEVLNREPSNSLSSYNDIDRSIMMGNQELLAREAIPLDNADILRNTMPQTRDRPCETVTSSSWRRDMSTMKHTNDMFPKRNCKKVVSCSKELLNIDRAILHKVIYQITVKICIAKDV